MARPTAPYAHLKPGQFYRLAQAFHDYDRRFHMADSCWRFHGHSFLPYEDGLSLFFIDERGQDLHIRLQHRPDAQASIIDSLETYLVACTAPTRTARAGLRDLTDDALTAFDGVDRFTLAWTDIIRVTLTYGQQHHDMTRCLEVDHRRGTSIFLPETEPLWGQFILKMNTHLDGAIPEPRWTEILEQHPGHTITVWKRRHFLHRIFGQ